MSINICHKLSAHVLLWDMESNLNIRLISILFSYFPVLATRNLCCSSGGTVLAAGQFAGVKAQESPGSASPSAPGLVPALESFSSIAN